MAGDGSMPHVLVVDDEPKVCDLMADILSPSCRVSTCTSYREALALCDSTTFDMVISDINMPDGDGMELIGAVRRRSPSTVTVLMTGYDVNDYLVQARQHGVSNIITKTSPLNMAEIRTEVETLLSGEIFGLRRHLLDGGEIVARYELRSSAEARVLRDEVEKLFAERFGSARDMKLVLDEIVTNAIYHAPATEDGQPKYGRFGEVRLAEGEYVEVECGYDSEKYGVSVTDRSGRLTKETVLERIERHVSGKGLTDTRGRGIHLSRLLSDRMIINIKPCVRTEVILMNYFEAKYRGFKPLYINEL